VDRQGDWTNHTGADGAVLTGHPLGREVFIQSDHPPRQPAWYSKTTLTFSDALAAVRLRLWCPENLAMSRSGSDNVEIPRTLLKRLTDTLCYAA
jgi:hypothetical protein